MHVNERKLQQNHLLAKLYHRLSRKDLGNLLEWITSVHYQCPKMDTTLSSSWLIDLRKWHISSLRRAKLPVKKLLNFSYDTSSNIMDSLITLSPIATRSLHASFGNI